MLAETGGLLSVVTTAFTFVTEASMDHCWKEMKYIGYCYELIIEEFRESIDFTLWLKPSFVVFNKFA